MTNALFDSLNLILNLLFSIYLGIVLLRLFMQYSRASFINPFAQFILSATNFFIVPLRKVFPPIKQFDTASLILALLVHTGFIFVLVLIYSVKINIANILLWSIAGIIATTLTLYTYCLYISIISSWLPDLRQHPVIQVACHLTNPIIEPFRRILPSLGGIDFSPIFPLLLIHFLLNFLKNIAYLHPHFILGI